MNELGLAIRLARVVSGKSQWDLAKQFGLHPVVINYIEHGKRSIDPILARAILKELKTSAPKDSRLASLVLAEVEKIVQRTSDT